MDLAADPSLAPLAAASGHRVKPEASLDDVEVVLVSGPDAWERVRRGRAAGVRATFVVHGTQDGPPDRAVLEPVAILRATTAEALSTALRRSGDRRPPDRLAGGHFEAASRRFLTVGGTAIDLTPLETRLLAYLASRASRAVDRDELQEEVWDHRTALDTKAVEVAVARLRRKIEPEPAAPITVLTVRGGYQVGVPADRGATGFVGRGDLVARLGRTLLSGSPVIAIVGPPGVGKSRTAAEIAEVLAGRGVRVHLVDLDRAPPGVEPGVALAVALDLDLPSSGDLLAAVIDQLRGGVLLLDHAEQRPGLVGPVVHAARGRCPVLLASQVLPDDLAVEVHLLPPLDDEAGAELLLAASGGAIDAEAARRVVPLLDGLPLALTLAGPRIAVLGPEAFERVVEQRLALLSPTGAGRHGSLRAAVTDAVDRLSPARREALHALLAFRGPFGADDAGTVLRDGLPMLVELVSHGVVAREGDRFRVLHAIRDHLLATVGPAPACAAARHAEWAVARLSSLVPRLEGSGARVAFAQLAALHADLRAALDHTVVPELVVALVEGLDRLLAIAGTEAERQRLLDGCEAVVAADPLARARLRLRRAQLLSHRDRVRAAAEGRALAEILADADPNAAARAGLLVARLVYRHDPAGALECLLASDTARLDAVTGLALGAMVTTCRLCMGEQPLPMALAELDRAMDELALLDALVDAVQVGGILVAYLRNAHPERCLPVIQQLVAWSELLRDPRITAAVLSNLATEYSNLGRLADARRELDAADALFARTEPGSRIRVAQRRAWIDLQFGDAVAARAGYEGVLGRAGLLGEVGIAAEVLIHLVLVEADSGRPAAAASRALEAIDRCQRLARPDLLAQAGLALGLARLLCGDAEEAHRVLSAVDRGHLAPSSQLSWLATSVVAARRLGLGPSPLDAELDRCVAEGPSTDVAEVRRLIGSGRVERVAELDLASRSVDLRLLARVWLAEAAP